jgi:hypothetical protein
MQASGPVGAAVARRPLEGQHLSVALILVAVLTGSLGAVVRRWWLLALPAAAAVGAGFLLVMPGTRVDPDNPLAFLLLLMEVCLASGVLLGKRHHPPAPRPDPA